MQPAQTTPQATTPELLELVYEELRRIAHDYFRNIKPGFTLCPTELVNEACLQLLRSPQGRCTSPEHFRAIATRKIWQVIVDHLRYRNAAKRGGQARESTAAPPDETAARPARRERLPLDAIQVQWNPAPVDLLDLADAIELLGQQNPRLREVVMLHWFAGMSYADAGHILGISASSAEKDFRFAMAWLSSRLDGGDGVR